MKTKQSRKKKSSNQKKNDSLFSSSSPAKPNPAGQLNLLRLVQKMATVPIFYTISFNNFNKSGFGFISIVFASPAGEPHLFPHTREVSQRWVV